MVNHKVSLIILNFNGWKDTIECLESIYQINYPNYDVILVDNASSDNSIDKIKHYCKGKLKVESSFFEYEKQNKPIDFLEITKEESESISKLDLSNKRLILIKNKDNYGFAEGNNIGIRFALKYLKSDYVLLLNNDTIVDKNFLKEMINVTGDKIGIVGSKIYFYDSPKLIQSAGVKINWYLGEVDEIGRRKKKKLNKIKEVESVSGCSMLINKEIFNEIGLIDNSYYLYYEDTDFCIRTLKEGFKVVFTPYSKIWHKTSVTSRKTTGLREFYSFRNLFLFMNRYSSKIQFFSFFLYFFCFKLWFNSVIIIIYHKELSAFTPFLKGIYNGIKLISLKEKVDEEKIIM